MHRSRITIVLIGDIEGSATSTHPGNERHMPGRTKGPYSITHREDCYRANSWSLAQWKSCSFGVDNPIGGISPVEGQVIAEQVPLLPCPPDTVPSTRVGTGTKLKRVPVGGVKSLVTCLVKCRSSMIKHRNLCT